MKKGKVNINGIVSDADIPEKLVKEHRDSKKKARRLLKKLFYKHNSIEKKIRQVVTRLDGYGKACGCTETAITFEGFCLKCGGRRIESL
jgi:hypothetical protein